MAASIAAAFRALSAAAEVADNALDRQFEVAVPDRIWVTDIIPEINQAGGTERKTGSRQRRGLGC
ncbi:hypothetical protein GCM10008024_28690 [Allgaiera indica]|uniref:Uncharacterized protein n=1 Tax=Allgaiera indica TaxID=765699 RepID=A0AAN4UTC2_9RHOB|nr:hypothetical protein GCM10008024_28690 [Allgaiera indica]